MEFSKEDEKKRTSLKVAFLLAIVVPLVIEVVFSLLGAEINPLLGQIELILVLLSFCLTGILTRSAAKGLAAVPAGWINYLIMIVLPFWNPYSAFYNAATPIGMLIPEAAGTVTIILIVVDLVVLTIMTFFTGLFSGGVSGAGIIGKIVCIFFLLLFLILPFTYIGVAKAVEGVGYLGAAAVDAQTIMDTGLNVTEILEDEDKLNELNEKLLEAGENMTNAANALSYVQQNVLIMVILQLAGYDDLLQLFDLIPAMATFLEVTPELLTGMFSLEKGLSQTFDFLSTASGASSSKLAPRYKTTAEYSPTFREGLSYLEYAVGNFSNAESGLVEAIGQIEGALDIPTLAELELEDITEMFSQIGDSIPSIISVGGAAVPFINATYETFLGMESIGENDFLEAQGWMSSASSHFVVADGLLSVLNTTGLWEPVADAVTVFTDMTDLLTDVVNVGANSTTCFVAFESAFAAMENLNKSKLYGADPANDLLWDNAEGNISLGNQALQHADAFITSATSKSNSYMTKNYGTMQPLGDMFEQFNTLVTQFSGNITDFTYVSSAIDNTFKSIKAFSTGINLLSTATLPAEFTEAANVFQEAMDNASAADTALSTPGLKLNQATIETWHEILMDGPDAAFNASLSIQQDLYHISEYCNNLASSAASSPEFIDFFVSIIALLDLGTILG